MEGEASQKAITGARGAPPVRRAAMIGMTPQEQKGLRAPTRVATRTATASLPLSVPSIFFARPARFR